MLFAILFSLTAHAGSIMESQCMVAVSDPLARPSQVSENPANGGYGGGVFRSLMDHMHEKRIGETRAIDAEIRRLENSSDPEAESQVDALVAKRDAIRDNFQAWITWYGQQYVHWEKKTPKELDQEIDKVAARIKALDETIVAHNRTVERLEALLKEEEKRVRDPYRGVMEAQAVLTKQIEDERAKGSSIARERQGLVETARIQLIVGAEKEKKSALKKLLKCGGAICAVLGIAALASSDPGFFIATAATAASLGTASLVRDPPSLRALTDGSAQEVEEVVRMHLSLPEAAPQLALPPANSQQLP